MTTAPKTFAYTLTEREIAEIRSPLEDPCYYEFHQMILTQLGDGNRTVALTDEEFGQLFMVITENLTHDFNKHMRRAFARSIRKDIATVERLHHAS